MTTTRWIIYEADRPGEPAPSRYDWTGCPYDTTDWYLCHERGTDNWWVSPGCVSNDDYRIDRGPFTREEAEALILTLSELHVREDKPEEEAPT